MAKKVVLERIKIIQTAREIGISKAANVYGVSRQTISRWLKQYQLHGLYGLENKSKVHQSQPASMPLDIEHKIINFKLQNPTASAAKIKNALGITYSIQTITKKMKKHPLLKAKDHQNVKDQICQPLLIFNLFFKRLNSGKSKVNIFFIEDDCWGIKFISLAEEMSVNSLLISLEVFLNKLKKMNLYHDKITLRLTKNYLNDKNAVIYKFLASKFNIVNLEVDSRKNKGNDFFEYYLKICQDDFSDQDLSEEDILNAILILFNTQKLRSLTNNELFSHIGKKYLDLCIDYSVFKSENYLKSLGNVADSKICLLNIIDQSVVKKKLLNLRKIVEYLKLNFKSILAEDVLINVIYLTKIYALDEFYSEFVFCLLDLYKTTGNWNKQLEVFNEIKPLVKNEFSDYSKAKYYKEYGSYFFNIHEYNSAKKIFKQFYKQSLKINDFYLINSALICLGNIAAVNGDYRKALQYYKKTLKSTSLDKENKTKALFNTAIVYTNRQKYNFALQYLFEALEVVKISCDHTMLRRIKTNIGRCYENEGKLKKALEYHLKALELSQRMNDLNGIANSYHLIGDVYSGLGDYAQSLDYLKKAYSYAIQSNDRLLLAGSSRSIALVYLELDSLKKANEYIDKALKNCQEIDNNYCICYDYNVKTLILLRQKKYKMALDSCRLAGSFASKLDDEVVSFQCKVLETKIKMLISVKKKENEIEYINNLLKALKTLNCIYSEENELSNRAYLAYEAYDLLKTLYSTYELDILKENLLFWKKQALFSNEKCSAKSESYVYQKRILDINSSNA